MKTKTTPPRTAAFLEACIGNPENILGVREVTDFCSLLENQLQESKKYGRDLFEQNYNLVTELNEALSHRDSHAKEQMKPQDLTDEQRIKLCAELDGITDQIQAFSGTWYRMKKQPIQGGLYYDKPAPNYPESYDAIITLIKKLSLTTEVANEMWEYGLQELDATPRQLTDALLVVAGKLTLPQS